MIVVVNRRRPIRRPAGNFRISLNAKDVSSAYRNSVYWRWLEDAKVFFEQIITNPNVTITVNVTFKDLGSGTLGQCGPGVGNWWEWVAFPFSDYYRIGNDYSIMTSAAMDMNTSYFKINPATDSLPAWWSGGREAAWEWRNQFFNIAVHEIFHGVGLGALWSGPFKIISVQNWNPTPWGDPVYTWQTLEDLWFPINSQNVVGRYSPRDPRYTKSAGLTAWRAQMVGQESVADIPIENVNVGSSLTTMKQAGGTALSHWRVSSTTGQPVPGRSVRNRKIDVSRSALGGQHIDSELMTGWSSRGMTGEYDKEQWVGRFTVQSLRGERSVTR